MNGDRSVPENPDTWLMALIALGGTALGTVGTMVAGFLRSSSSRDVGMTQAQAQMLKDAWENVVAQREIIIRQDREICEVREMMRDERAECDRRLTEQAHHITELQDRICRLEE